MTEIGNQIAIGVIDARAVRIAIVQAERAIDEIAGALVDIGSSIELIFNRFAGKLSCIGKVE